MLKVISNQKRMLEILMKPNAARLLNIQRNNTVLESPEEIEDAMSDKEEIKSLE